MTDETDAARADRLERAVELMEVDRDNYRELALYRDPVAGGLIADFRAQLAEAKREGWKAGREAAAHTVAMFPICMEEYSYDAIDERDVAIAAAIRALTPPDFDAPVCKDSLQTENSAGEQDDDVTPMSAETYSSLRKLAAEITQAQEAALSAENAKLREALESCDRVLHFDLRRMISDGPDYNQAVKDAADRARNALAATKPDGEGA